MAVSRLTELSHAIIAVHYDDENEPDGGSQSVFDFPAGHFGFWYGWRRRQRCHGCSAIGLKQGQGLLQQRMGSSEVVGGQCRFERVLASPIESVPRCAADLCQSGMACTSSSASSWGDALGFPMARAPRRRAAHPSRRALPALPRHARCRRKPLCTTPAAPPARKSHLRWGTVDADPAAHHFGEVATDGEAEAGAACLRVSDESSCSKGWKSRARSLSAMPGRRRTPRSAVAGARCCPAGERRESRCSRSVNFHGVAGEIPEDLAESHRVAAQQWWQVGASSLSTSP